MSRQHVRAIKRSNDMLTNLTANKCCFILSLNYIQTDRQRDTQIQTDIQIDRQKQRDGQTETDRQIETERRTDR